MLEEYSLNDSERLDVLEKRLQPLEQNQVGRWLCKNAKRILLPEALILLIIFGMVVGWANYGWMLGTPHASFIVQPKLKYTGYGYQVTGSIELADLNATENVIYLGEPFQAVTETSSGWVAHQTHQTEWPWSLVMGHTYEVVIHSGLYTESFQFTVEREQDLGKSLLMWRSFETEHFIVHVQVVLK